MRKTANLFVIALFSGAITLGAYKLLFEKDSNISFEEEETPFVNTSLATSAKGAGINEVDFTIAAEKTVNAVVHVKNMTLSKGSPFGSFLFGYEASPRPQLGTGSGVIISPDGYIVTNNHVIERSQELEVTLNNNKTYKAEIIGADANTDIALLKIDAEETLPYLAFGDSDDTKIGEWVLAVGNPFNLTSTVTAGIVSAKARSISSRSSQSFIQTDAAVNPGNSGGALVNTNGDLIGINTAITSQTGSYVGYSFAVPSNIANKIVNDLLEFGNVQKGILGIRGGDITPGLMEEVGIEVSAGVYVGFVEEETGAYEAGIKEGDVITMVDDIKVTKFSELTGYLSAKRPGDKVKVGVIRNGETKEIPVVLKKRLTDILPIMGLTVKNLSKEDQKRYGTKKGVKIVSVPEFYKDYGLENKVIVEVYDDEIEDIDKARSVFGKISKYDRISLTTLNEKGERERLIFR